MTSRSHEEMSLCPIADVQGKATFVATIDRCDLTSSNWSTRPLLQLLTLSSSSNYFSRSSVMGLVPAQATLQSSAPKDVSHQATMERQMPAFDCLFVTKCKRGWKLEGGVGHSVLLGIHKRKSGVGIRLLIFAAISSGLL
jgi:hypothetical protein